MPKRTTNVYIIPDDAQIVRVSEIIERVGKGESIRSIAAEFGVSGATIHRAIGQAGYELQTALVKKEAE